MKKIIIIGTLHEGLTPKKEIIKVLEKYKSNQILVEISQEDLKKEKLDSYPQEMIDVYNWAKEEGIKVNGFDSKINILKKGFTEKDNKRVVEEMKKLMGNFTWKDMNKEKNLKILDTIFYKELIDSKKDKKREFEMLENINKIMTKKGNVIIVTGCGHLNFFEENFKDAVFPFR